MYPGAKERWLLDTNIIIDLIIGLVCYVTTKELPNGNKLCDSIIIKFDNIQNIIQDLTSKKKLLENKIRETIEGLASSFAENDVELIITSTTKEEAYNVINKLKGYENRLNKKEGKWLWIFLPLDYLIDYTNVMKMIIESSKFIQVINVEDKQDKAKRVIKEILHGKYDVQDWHLVAALMSDDTLTAIYTEEDSVARGLRIIARSLGRRINVGNFGKFLINLRIIDILSPEQLYTISYYAYKFQRLLYSHQMVYKVGLHQKTRSDELSVDALGWVAYVQRRLQHYIPLNRILKSFRS